MIKAEIIADSISPSDNRITTFVVKFPRIVLAELNTHRMLAKSSSSSRAISFEKMLEKVKTDPFIPIRFQKKHNGMQGNEYFEGTEHDDCVNDWLNCRDSAVIAAQSFKHDVTKQLRNRLLEPFMLHTVIITGTDFENYFALRSHEDAEIHIQELAYKMLDAYNKSNPNSLYIGDWHIPFGDKFDRNRLTDIISKYNLDETMAKVAIATARCARVSYYNFEGTDDYEKDIALHDRLLKSKPMHSSPAEHCAVCMGHDKYIGPFRGWKQYRKFLNGENATDHRVVKKKYDKEWKPF